VTIKKELQHNIRYSAKRFKVLIILSYNLLSVGDVIAGNASNNEVETATMSAAWCAKVFTEKL
jgi:hypothetical protein